MPFSGNNQSLFNAAFNGAMAGSALALKDARDATQADYATIATNCMAFAQEVDSLIVADATLTNAGATIVPASAANQQNALSKPSLMFSLCFGYWAGRSPPTDATVADYAGPANAIKAAFNAAVAQYANAPGGTSLS